MHNSRLSVRPASCRRPLSSLWDRHRRTAILWALTPLLLLIVGLPPAGAHQLQVEPVVVVIRPQESFLSTTFKGNVQDILVGVSVKDTERKGDDFTPDAQKRVQDYVNERFVVEQGGRTLKGVVKGLTYQSDMSATKSRFRLDMRYPRSPSLPKNGSLKITSRLFDYLPNAQTILSIGGIQKTLSPGQSVTFDPSQIATNLFRNIRDFTLLGMEHIFTGPDHMLFILALLMVSSSFWSLAKTLTGFTVAHSITLVLSALSVVILPDKLTDVLIALSIVYVGLENIFAMNHRNRFWVAAGFGLVHGFGFSGVLREIGLPEQGLVWCLLSFNLGVEIAQVILCAIAFPLLMVWKKDVKFREQYGRLSWVQVVRATSVVVAMAGGYWLIQRAIG